MPRAYFLLPVAHNMANAILNNIDKISYDNDTHTLIFARQVKEDLYFSVHIQSSFRGQARQITIPGQLSAAPDNSWDIYCLSPKDDDYVIGPKAQLYLGKVYRSALNENAQGEKYIGRPMSLTKAAELFPAFANKYMRKQMPLTWTAPDPGSLLTHIFGYVKSEEPGVTGVLTWTHDPDGKLHPPVQFAGEDLDSLEKANFRPTTEQEDADELPTEEDVFGPVVPPEDL